VAKLSLFIYQGLYESFHETIQNVGRKLWVLVAVDMNLAAARLVPVRQ
jgi:hypothetical protein